MATIQCDFKQNTYGDEIMCSDAALLPFGESVIVEALLSLAVNGLKIIDMIRRVDARFKVQRK